MTIPPLPELIRPVTHPPVARLPGRPWGYGAAARFLGVCRKTIESYAKQSRIATIRIGRRVLIPDAEVVRIATAGLDAPIVGAEVARD